ncbi:PucR family transcriptional regulator [Paracoccus siganidrum]|uniref:PucR family transcriptional regulator n=1 Tax=Paracoccus siganidrum TaxID=1276757 RepID=A0A419A5L4_9RHOB|nr:PucR family transcriptional regulator [Paracoccus siganidrum]RJL12327.1 PucR family transcriptional regulator [Paracoccus siganidrum]RMC29882.1 PucR family transcriptional regulator [Paracoccus siganidrum]
MSLRIADIIDIPELRTRLLSGSEGAGRLVRWAHVCELPDPTEWLGEGDLLMTTGIGIPADPAAQRRYVEALAQAGLSGMMIGEDMQAPADLRALRDRAGELGFPVLMTHYGVPFASVTRAVIDARRSEEFERSQAIARIYVSARIAIEGIDLEALLHRLEEDVQARLMLWDPQTQQPWLPRGRELPEKLGEALRQQKLDPPHSQPMVRRYPLEEGEVLGIGIPSRRKCVLLVRRSGRDVLDYGLLNHLSAVLGIALERLHVENERAIRLGSELLEDLLNNRLTRQQAGKRLAPFGIALDSAHLAVARRGGLSLPDWAALFERSDAPVLLCPQGDELWLLLPEDSAPAVQAVLEAGMGLSDQVGYFERLAEAFSEARLAAAHAGADRPVVFYAQIADKLPWLPQNLDEARETFRRVLGNLAEHDEESRASLLYTLKIFLEQNRSWQATAEKLHIHKTSLTYRIRRIEALTGRSLGNTGDVVALWLALQAAEILGLPQIMGPRR